jgi:hypothetical protein
MNDSKNYNFTSVLSLLSLFAVIIHFTACENPLKRAARNVGYSAYEMVGIHKRELLKTRVDDARDEQKEAGEDFRDALQKLKDIYGFDGGKLEKKYDSLQSSYERARHQSETVKKSVAKVETVAKDLFDEWEKEIDSMETASLKDRSRQSLYQTKQKYHQMHSTLKAAEAKLDPVLNQLRDQVLFLKHNLNAKAIGSLKGEGIRIQKDVEVLIAEMNKSINSADKFISEMKEP